MMPSSSRRGFLCGLTTLPLIGGGVTLIGSPTAVAEHCTPRLLESYVAFLAREYGHAHDQLLAASPDVLGDMTGGVPVARMTFTNWPASSTADALVRSAPPSTRAALVLSAVGCDWRA